MKKYAKIISILLLVFLLATALFACINPDRDSQGKMKLVVLYDEENAEEYTVDLADVKNSSNGLIAILDYLQNNGMLEYSANDSGYGAYLTKVGGLKEGNGYYLYVYTDVEADFDVTQYASQISYKNKTFTNIGIGVSQMSIKSGCTIIITLIKF